MDYAKLYNDLISFRRSNPLASTKTEYTEVHHIIPKCLGGSDSKSNLIRLSVREHFIAHRLLAKMYPDSSYLTLSVYLMVGGSRNRKSLQVISSKGFLDLRRKSSVIQSRESRKYWANPSNRSKQSNLKLDFYKNLDNRRKLQESRANPEFRDSIRNAKLSIFLPDTFESDDPRHLVWEKADLLHHHLWSSGHNTGRVSSTILKLCGLHRRNRKCANSLLRRFNNGWAPLEDDTWIKYTELRSEGVGVTPSNQLI